MQQVRKTPVFISLAGIETATDELFTKLTRHVPSVFSALKCVSLPSPFGDYPNLRIGGKRKRDFTPAARTCFRWGLFYEFNATEIRPVFESGADIVMVRHFGFDLYAGAVSWRDCEHSLAMHEALVKYGVGELGLCPPLYVFTETLEDKLRSVRDRYFRIEGQRYGTVDPNLSIHQKVDAVTALIRHELLQKRSNTAEAAVA